MTIQYQTAAARAKISSIESDLEDLKDILDIIDVSECGEPEEPEEPTIPTAVNCLAGTIPSWGVGNLNAGESTEQPWVNDKLAFRTKMAACASGTIMLIGDSMLQRLGETGAHAISQYCENFGISGESMRQLILRINENDINNQPNLIHRAGAVVLLTGVNDVGTASNYGASTTTPAGKNNAVITFGQILDKLSNWLTGPLVIVKMVHVNTSVFTFPANDVIDSCNAIIDTKFGGKPNCVIIDINPTVSPSGSLLPAYSTDGQHLDTTAGKTVLQDAIRVGLEAINIV